VTGPVTHLGWAPPWTDTPGEIERRRRDAVAEIEGCRARASSARRTRDREAWDAVIAEFQAENGADDGSTGGAA
jgi:hypothetical protein